MFRKLREIQRPAVFVAVAFAIGFVIGISTLGGQKILPDALGQIANSGAVWSVIAFVLGRAALSGRVGALAGFVALVGEVLGYYAVAYVAQLVELSPSSMLVIGYWLFVALVAGPLFGWAGYASVHAAGIKRIVAKASLAAAFIGEGLYLLTVLPTAQTTVVWLAIAVIITIVLTWRDSERVKIGLATVVLGLVFFGAEQVLVWLDKVRAGIP